MTININPGNFVVIKARTRIQFGNKVEYGVFKIKEYNYNKFRLKPLYRNLFEKNKFAEDEYYKCDLVDILANDPNSGVFENDYQAWHWFEHITK